MRALTAACVLTVTCSTASAVMVGCHTPTQEPPSPTPSTSASATAAATVTVTAAATVTASATVTVTATATASATAPGPAPATVGSHVDGNHFTVDVAAPPACAHDAECTFTAKVTAQGEFHVNQEYPYKLKMDDAPGVTFLGKDAQGPTNFSKSAGDFSLAGEKVGVMTVRYRAAAGGHPVTGTLKLSVCNASACLLEQAKVTATVAAR